MDDYVDYFLNSRANVAQLELIEVTHPDFSQEHRFVRNAFDGVTVDLSPDRLAVFFPYYPARVTTVGARDDLDNAVRVELGDLGEIIRPEMDRVEDAGGFMTKPRARYWVFRSDVLNAPIFGPLDLEITDLSFDGQSTSFEAIAPRLNVTRTGERYKLDRFPMLRGFL